MLKSINSYLLISYIKNNMYKFVYHEVTSMKQTSVNFSTISQYMVVVVRSRGAVPFKENLPPAPYTASTIAGVAINYNIVHFRVTIDELQVIKIDHKPL